jgi:2-oxoglutarate dehydrogenase E2 component (dihydrolipoamide succinyltransferase)
LFSDNDVIGVGKPFAIISTGGEEELSTAPIISEKIEEKKVEELVKKEVALIESNIAPPIALTSNEDRFYSPLVMNIAKEEGISQAELDSIPALAKVVESPRMICSSIYKIEKVPQQQKTILPSPDKHKYRGG